MLLGVAERGSIVWPRKGRALIVDEFDLVRRVVVASLARFGCTCYSAGTCEAGLRLWERDRDVDVVIVDYESAGAGLASFLRRLRTDRPGITIVGTSASPMREAFQAAGIELYVDKPYMVPDVVDLLGSVGEGGER